MRLGYLSQDRPEVQFSAKELARCVAERGRRNGTQACLPVVVDSWALHLAFSATGGTGAPNDLQ
eukprot:9882031-Prorocentrum_lima.AAC.1